MSIHHLPRRSAAEVVLDRIDRSDRAEPDHDTVPTGFPSLDRVLGGGLRNRDLVVIGGDVGSGKSALALGVALRVAESRPVVYCSGEMNEERLTERALAIQGRVEVDDLRAGNLTDEQRAAVGAAAVRLRDAQLRTVAMTGMGLDGLEQLDAFRGPSLVIVDYLQILPSPAVHASLAEDLAVTLTHLKQFALRNDVPVVVATQLAADLAHRGDPRPTLDDFGAAGAVKQHADLVLAIYREEMYRADAGLAGATELIVAKNRNGPTGFVDLYFYQRWMRFEDMLDPDR